VDFALCKTIRIHSILKILSTKITRRSMRFPRYTDVGRSRCLQLPLTLAMARRRYPLSNIFYDRFPRILGDGASQSCDSFVSNDGRTTLTGFTRRLGSVEKDNRRSRAFV
jgi:hypothetical protein